jgi:hypothetical protein
MQSKIMAALRARQWIPISELHKAVDPDDARPSASASLSRAISTLEKRGQVERFDAGTATGKHVPAVGTKDFVISAYGGV